MDTVATIHSTSGCKRFDHPECEIRVSSPAIPEVDIAWLLGFIESYIASGARLNIGETMQIGWMLVRIEEGRAGALRLTEPDMRSFPVHFIDSVDHTLLHLRNQNDVVRSLSLATDPLFPSLRQSAVVHVNYKHANSVSMKREVADGLSSGWVITDTQDLAGLRDPARFLTTSLYQLGLDRPELIKFFALPPMLEVSVDNGRTRVCGPNGALSLVPGSYLSELSRRMIRGGS
ncbi:immunity protein Imm33 domain-containing protein [Paraburkholderia aromaticivorans]|uniref:immunity protein Imm33 domain-containing protein n=1 Tax=Paraburkholderia aromaticivorans TaxID=2026199 RepID=UPI0038B8FC95